MKGLYGSSTDDGTRRTVAPISCARLSARTTVVWWTPSSLAIVPTRQCSA
jgi:hypothetical protein